MRDALNRLLPLACALLGIVAVLTALAVVLIDWRVGDRTTATRSQLEALRDVDTAAGTYGRQTANQLLYAYSRGGGLQDARNAMERSLAALTRATYGEIDSLFGQAELQSELPEIEQVRRMVDLYHAIDASATEAFRQLGQGDAAGARQTLQRDVDFRLGNELQPLIDASIADETGELGAQEHTRALWQRAAIAAGIVVALLAGLALWATARRDRRTADARVEELARSARQAEQRHRDLNEGRAKLLADVGHQLRTPLTVLRGEADVALRGERTADGLADALARIRQQAAELGHLLEDFITTARESGESLAVSLGPTEVDDVVREAVDEATVLLDSRELSLALDLKAAAQVSGDPRYLKQAVTIGIDNAIKHSPPGGRIEASTERRGDGVLIRICDQGPGVSEADRPHLFERFFRGTGEDDLLNPGFGIGLSIAKDIIDQHNGLIDLDNRPEGGAVFSIRLPLLAAP